MITSRPAKRARNRVLVRAHRLGYPMPEMVKLLAEPAKPAA
jgi:hypothetical protein